MSEKKSIRIPVSSGDKLINVELKNDIDLLEILSLKFTQTDVYSSGLCSDYGVVCGRISANNGLGIPNAKVSIFVPLDNTDEIDPVISALYPYKNTADKNDDGYRYNLLPKRKQHGGHTPTGTFFDQEDILSNEEYLEVFEKYYNYTAKTNNSGDFMIWGVPIGTQKIHIDIDLSDIGCFSLRPYDFIRKGVGEEKFERVYSFKSSSDIDGLPQIVQFEKTIEVYPFIGNEELCEIGISRVDFDLTEADIKIEPVSLILVSTVTDKSSAAIKKNGKIKEETGYKCNLQTIDGTIESVRFTGGKVYGSNNILYPELEYFNITETINENGVAMVVLPMNIDYVYTNEFGETEVTSDKNKGIPTKCISRFRIGLNDNGRKTTTAKYLVPNIREFNNNINGTNGASRKWGGEYERSLILTYTFSDVYEDYLRIPNSYNDITFSPIEEDTSIIKLKDDLIQNFDTISNEIIPQDYFYKFTYGKVYAVSSFQGTYFDVELAAAQQDKPEDALNEKRVPFLGLKQIRPSEEDDCASTSNYFPVNYAYKNSFKFTTFLSELTLFLNYIFTLITVMFFEMIGRFLFLIGNVLNDIYFGWPFNIRPFEKLSEIFYDFSYRIQEYGTHTLSLTTYPDCTECNSSSDNNDINNSYDSEYICVGEIKLKVFTVGIGESFNNETVLIPIEIRASNDDVSYLDQNNKAADLYDGPRILSGYTDGTILSPSQKTEYRNSLLSLSTKTVTISGDPNPSRFVAFAYSIVDDIDVEKFNPYNHTLPYTNGVTESSYSFDNFFTNITNSSENEYITPVMKFESRTGIDSTTWGGGTAGYGDQMFKWVSNFGTSGTTTSAPFCIVIKRTKWRNMTTINYGEYHGTTYYNGNIVDRGTYVVLKIYDRAKPKNSSLSGSTMIIEQGCEKYDKLYDESNVFAYLQSTSSEYGSSYLPITPPNYDNSISETSTDVILSGHTIMATIGGVRGGTSETLRMPRFKKWKKIGNTYYDRKTKSGLTEIRDGVFTIIPVINGTSKNVYIIREWYRRKRIGLSFCSGVVNYTFTDNWLTGLLYFFKFNKKIKWDDQENYDLGQRTSKYPRDLIFFNILDNNFYYRSTPYDPTTNTFVGQKVSESFRQILHPTTFYDLGVRDEFFYEICSNPELDPNCSVIRDITSTSYQDPANIVEYGISYSMDISKGLINVNDFFKMEDFDGGTHAMNGEYIQLMSINSEVGVEEFDLNSPQYFMYNNDILDPENITTKNYFTSGGTYYGPLPIDFKFDTDGERIRRCLNYSLGDYSQIVPFYLWDKKGDGFGEYGVNKFNQLWDRSVIASNKLQRIFSVNSAASTTTNYVMNDGEEEYLLMPMTITHDGLVVTGNSTDAIERFDFITLTPPSNLSTGGASGYTESDVWLHVKTGTTKDPIAGDIYVVVNKTWVKQSFMYLENTYETFIFDTHQNYIGNKQVLSTPFMFYFGLRPQNSALDLLIKYYGPKGAFPSTD